jgi:hypothetical protein
VAPSGPTFAEQTLSLRLGFHERVISEWTAPASVGENSIKQTLWTRGSRGRGLMIQLTNSQRTPQHRPSRVVLDGNHKRRSLGKSKKSTLIESSARALLYPDSVPQKYPVGLYIDASDPQLAANQRAALRRYAENMGWTITIEIAGEIEPLIHAAGEHAIQLVLCWRLSDMPEAESLFTRLRAIGVDLLPLAQSCAALQE